MDLQGRLKMGRTTSLKHPWFLAASFVLNDNRHDGLVELDIMMLQSRRRRKLSEVGDVSIMPKLLQILLMARSM